MQSRIRVKAVLKEWLKSLLFRAGYEVRKLSRFEWLLLRELATGRPFVFVQVGANDGVSFDSLYWFVTTHGATGLVVEPLADMYELLKYNYRSYPRIVPVRAAVHPSRATVTLHRVRPGSWDHLPPWATGIASVDPLWHRISQIPDEEIVTEEVPAVHLMTLLADYGITRLSLLQIDTEGFDVEVVKMIDFGVIRPSIIKYEAVRPGAQDDAERLLRLQGYRLERCGNDMVAWTPSPMP